ncbi:sensor histidine kinase [Noviherbaspirillum sp. 17J57-3]|uniref:C4-dicarboxylate transport sensor protein DctB n=2 Tax=Noviherbaspirillum galbum TaxID=2709383 RepID=A0A6B3SFP5_9BURK|nr:sensor histidine kinase [Noviherbaspirillum galbum]
MEQTALPKRAAWKLLLLALLAAITWLAYAAAHHHASRILRDQADRQLEIIAHDLDSIIDKFETLPFALSFHPDVIEAASSADAPVVSRLNAALQAIQRQSGVSVIYLIDRAGNTVASSNWDDPQSFIGLNFRFRPYFIEAEHGRTGRFYGIGTRTGEAGYFIAQPVYRQASAIAPAVVRPNGADEKMDFVGVLVVKISLTDFERSWGTSEEPIALSDALGVVFLSNRDNIKYRSLAPLPSAAEQRLAGTLQYAGRQIEPIAALPLRERVHYSQAVERAIGPSGWKLMLFPSPDRPRVTAGYAALMAFVIMASGLLAAWARLQRRRRIEERLSAREALAKAAEELDQRIAQRTEELLQANQRLETKYTTLKQTETLLRATQDELLQASKLALLGQMAAGVTHEINQPLAAIRAFADNSLRFLDRDNTAQVRANLAHISSACARMGAIISQLKGFARKSGEQLEPVRLADAVESALLLLEGDISAGRVAVLKSLDPRCRVVGDRLRIEQVLINLLRNAIDAVEHAAAPEITITLAVGTEDVLLAVADNGPGIPENVASRLFEPFYTTKPSGKGLGLGLAISSSIIHAMNGELAAENLPAGGACFTIRLKTMIEPGTEESH